MLRAFRVAARSCHAQINAMSTRPKRKAVGAGELKAKRAKGGTDLGWDLAWMAVGEPSGKLNMPPLYVLQSPSLPGSEKIAGFDMDHTLIKPKSGRKFPTGKSDWTWMFDCVPAKLQQLHKDGYRVVVITNQLGIEKMKQKLEDITAKIEDIAAHLAIPIIAFISTGLSQYRKPGTGKWEYLLENLNSGVEVDMDESFYVGDAAGRPKDWQPGKPKDFNCADRMFAANVGLTYQTPEEYFLGEAPGKFEWKSMDPKEYLKKASKANDAKYHSTKPEMILMVGPPASGKSTFSRRYLTPHGYAHINRDLMNTTEKCLKVTKEALKDGKKVVVDNTNPSADARAEFIKLAKQQGVDCRCFVIVTPLELAHHLNLMRMYQTEGKVRRVPDVAYNMYKKNFVEPSATEGFTEIKHINFVPIFDTPRDEKLFLQWTSG